MTDTSATQLAPSAAEHVAQNPAADNPVASGSAAHKSAAATEPVRTGSTGAAIMRVTLGVVVLATWWGNVDSGIYSAEGLQGFFTWLGQSAEEGGNGGTLGFVHSFLGSVIGPIAGPFGAVQSVVELVLGIALVFGIATRAAALGAIGFFVSLFLAYFGGEEWIWTYVLLTAGAVAVFLDFGGRKWGLDQAIIAKTGVRNSLFL